MDWGIFLCIVIPCALALAAAGAEGWLAARPWAGGSRFLLPGASGGLLVLAGMGYLSAVGWDTIGWGYLVLLAGALLMGALVGLAAGTAIRKMRN